VRKFTSYNPACDDGEQGHAGTDAQVRQNIEAKVLSRLSIITSTVVLLEEKVKLRIVISLFFRRSILGHHLYRSAHMMTHFLSDFLLHSQGYWGIFLAISWREMRASSVSKY
jgi:hypothetical protein